MLYNEIEKPMLRLAIKAEWKRWHKKRFHHFYKSKL